MAENTVKAEEMVEETPIIDAKPSIKEAIKESRPVAFVRRHAKGFIAGTVGAVAVGAAAVILGKKAGDGMIDVTDVTDTIVEALPIDADA